ncbi:MAG: DUF2804 domain-containing protein [Anaerolineaceae bacterium]
MQTLLTQPSPLLTTAGALAQVGWSRQPLLDCNLEAANFYALRFLQKFRVKRWDYYAVFSPTRFFSATIADLGYAGNIFIYTLDFAGGELKTAELVVPLAKGVELPRNSTEGGSHYEDSAVKLHFTLPEGRRRLSVDWPSFDEGRGLSAEIDLAEPPGCESMNLTIPIGRKRFYFNRKINCLPASGWVKYPDRTEMLDPHTCAGSLDWGRGVWEYSSYWNWASASGFLPDGRTVGLNLGCGFGDLSKAGENAAILANRMHKFEQVKFDYTPGDYMKPWHFADSEGRLDVTLTPFKDRTARTNLGPIFSEVHQMFGRYNGSFTADDGEVVVIKDLVGFAEEHHARW